MYKYTTMLVQRFETECGRRADKMCNARTVREAVALGDMQPEPRVVAHVADSFSYARLQRAMAFQVEKLIDQECRAIRHLKSVADQARRCQAAETDWAWLIGTLPELYQRVRKFRRGIEAKAAKAEPTGTILRVVSFS